MKKIIAIIPARGGSKGVPKKNIRKLKGFPLIAYSIAVCLMAKNISEIIISTDSKEIASIAEKFGAKVPFLRPKSISRDSSRDIEFVKHAINFYKRKKNNTPKNWAIIRPTTPLRDPKKIDNAINKYFKIKDATSLVSVHEIAETPPKMFGMKGEYLHGLSPFDPREEYYTLPRQAFPPSYFGNGYIDIVNTKNIIQNNTFYGDRIVGYETPDDGEIDIENDFKKIEFNITQKFYKVHSFLKNNEYSKKI